jgi:hypothetical protein
MAHSAASTLGGRLAGERPSRTRAAMTALAAGTTTTVVVYRWLRRGAEDPHADD